MNIYVGRNCFINYNSVFLDVAPITLGDNVLIGPNVTLATPNHPFIAEERAYTDYPNGCHALEHAEPITIGDHCWLCAGATVCGGVTIGAGSIIAAGAVPERVWRLVSITSPDPTANSDASSSRQRQLYMAVLTEKSFISCLRSS